MRETYEIVFYSCVAVSMVLLVVGLVRRKPGEYLDNRKYRPLIITAVVFLVLGIASAFLTATTPATTGMATAVQVRN